MPVSEELSARAEVLAKGGPELWEQFMDELRAEHLGSAAASRQPTVREQLEEAYRSAHGR